MSPKIREEVKDVVRLVERALKREESLKVAVLGEAGVGKITCPLPSDKALAPLRRQGLQGPVQGLWCLRPRQLAEGERRP